MTKKREIVLSSTQKLYEKIAQGECSGFTVPAFNLRTLTFDAARALFKAAKKEKAGAFIVELAQSEMGYTDQSPEDYANSVLKAAVEEKFEGPVFLQGDHFKIKREEYQTKNTRKKELEKLQDLTKKAIGAGFYNIDIDCSSLLVKENFAIVAFFTDLIRKLEPKNLTISIGAEIGEIGGKNTTIEEFNTFITGYEKAFSEYGAIKGIIKIAVQTGTSHGKGGKIDFKLLQMLSEKAKDYGLAGIVQHGASTLPEKQFKQFPKMKVLEIHLATELQNIILKSPYFPERLKFKAKKELLGKFKKEINSLPQKNIDKICDKLQEKFRFFFQQLNVSNTQDLIKKVYPVK